MATSKCDTCDGSGAVAIPLEDGATCPLPCPECHPSKPERPYLYVLYEKTPLPVSDVLVWAATLGRSANQVAYTELTPTLTVSTVFLGVDLNYGRGAPLLFESIMFDDGEPVCCYRTSTWTKAWAQHRALLSGFGERNGD